MNTLPIPPINQLLEPLTSSEKTVLSLMAEGLSDKEIGLQMNITPMTIRGDHKQNIYDKLGLEKSYRSKKWAVYCAHTLGLIRHVDDNILPFEFDNPYKGLETFQEQDAPLFFGRESDVEKLIQCLDEMNKNSRLLALVGASGVGKSSIIRAGLIPALHHNLVKGSNEWAIATIFPRVNPYYELESALKRLTRTQDDLLNMLQRDAYGLIRVCDLLFDRNQTFLLIIDQFEEMFTLVESDQLARDFMDTLYTASTDPRSKIRIIITIRADFLDRPLMVPDFSWLIEQNIAIVGPMSADEIEQAITQPARQARVEIDKSVVAKLVSESTQQPGALPLLEFTLAELYDNRIGNKVTLDAYESMGGLQKGLAIQADKVFTALNRKQQEVAKQVFLRLITLGEGTEDVRRRVMLKDLIILEDLHDSIEATIQHLTGNRLLTMDIDYQTGEATVEVAHEALIREWERLRDWLNNLRDELRQEREIAQIAQRWQDSGRSADFLLHGSRLEQAEVWQAHTEIALTPLEVEFIQQSINKQETDDKAEAERQEREAGLERRSRNFLRGLVAVMAMGLVVAVILAVIANNERNNARDALKYAERSADELRSIALSFGALDALNSGQSDVALALAQEAISMDSPPLAAEEIFLTASTSTWLQQRLLVSENRVWDAAYHPDRERIITTSWDGRITIWDIETGEELKSLQADGRINNIGIHPDAKTIAIGGSNGLVRIWNTETGDVVELVSGEGNHSAPTFTQDGTRLVTVSDGTTVIVWNTETWEILFSWEAHDFNFLPGVHFNSDDSMLITSSPDNFVKIWEFETGELLQSFDLGSVSNFNPPWVWDSQMLPDNEHVLIAGSEDIVLWNWRTDEVVWQVTISGDLVQDIALSPDKSTFVVGYGTGVAEIRHTLTGDLIRKYEGHSQRVQNVDFSPDGSTVLTASNDGTVGLWVANWEGALLAANTEIFETIAWHPDGGMIALAPPDVSAITIIDSNSGQVLNTLEGHREGVNALYFTPDGRYLASGDVTTSFYEDHHVIIWDIATGNIVHELTDHLGWIQALTSTTDGQILAVGEAEGLDIVLWDLENGNQLKTLEGHKDWVNALIFDPSDQFIFSGSRDGSLNKWDIETGEIIQQFEGHSVGINSIALDNTRAHLISASEDRNAIVWDIDTGDPVMTLEGHTAPIRSVEISPDDSLIMTAARDGLIILWDAETGERLNTFVATSVADRMDATFSPDGARIASINASLLTIWDATYIPEIYEDWVTNHRYTPDFNCAERELYRIEPLCHPTE